MFVYVSWKLLDFLAICFEIEQIYLGEAGSGLVVFLKVEWLEFSAFGISLCAFVNVFYFPVASMANVSWMNIKLVFKHFNPPDFSYLLYTIFHTAI